MKIDVKIYARRFELLCMGLIPFIVLAPVLVWFFGDKLTDSTYGLDLGKYSFLQRLFFLLVTSMGNLFVAYGLWLCIGIARLFKKEEIFSPATTDLFARLSKTAAWWGLYNMLVIIYLYAVLMPNSPKQLTIFVLGVNGLTYLFIFIFLSILATMIAKASELQKDQDLTV